VLVVHGSEDRLISPELGRAVRAQAPHPSASCWSKAARTTTPTAWPGAVPRRAGRAVRPAHQHRVALTADSQFFSKLSFHSHCFAEGLDRPKVWASSFFPRTQMETIGTWWMWTGFAVFVVVAIAIDLLVMEKQGAHKVTMKEAVRWSVIWFSLAFVFVGWLWWYLDGSQGREVANTVSMQFITGYLVEKSLSIDNIFVFLMIFSYFAVPAQYQKRALIMGIIGAIVLRAIC
jgi:hypothetical protein